MLVCTPRFWTYALWLTAICTAEVTDNKPPKLQSPPPHEHPSYNQTDAATIEAVEKRKLQLWEAGATILESTVLEVLDVSWEETLQISTKAYVNYDPLVRAIQRERELSYILAKLARFDFVPANISASSELEALFARTQIQNLFPDGRLGATPPDRLIPIARKLKQLEDVNDHMAILNARPDPKFWFVGFKSINRASEVDQGPHASLPLAECRHHCKKEGGRAAAPADDNEVRLMRRITNTSDTWFAHIDREWSMSESRWVNPVTGKATASCYKKSQLKIGAWIGSSGQYLEDDTYGKMELDDDFGTALYVVSNPDVLWRKAAENMLQKLTWSMRYYIPNKNDRYQARCICQRLDDAPTKMPRLSTPSKRVSHLAKQMLADGADTFSELADQHEAQLTELLGKYGVDKWVHIGFRNPIEYVEDPGRPNERYNRFSRALPALLGVGASVAVPLAKTAMSFISQLSEDSGVSALDRARQIAYFWPSAYEKVQKAYNMAEEAAQDIGTLRLEQQQLADSVEDVTKELAQCTTSLQIQNSEVEALSVRTSIYANAAKHDHIFQTALANFGTILRQASQKQTPRELVTGEIMQKLQSVLASAHGLSLQTYLQDSKADIIPSKRPNELIILATLKATGTPWAIMKQTAVPQWVAGRLWQATLPTTYFAMNREFSHYIPLTEYQVEQCRQKACNFRGPFRPLAHYRCGPGLLTGGLLNACPLVQLEARDFFAPTEFGLVYAVHKPEVVSLLCAFDEDKQFPSTISIQHSGMVQIAPGCQITTPTGEIYKGPVYSEVQVDLAYTVEELGSNGGAISTIVRDHLVDETASSNKTIQAAIRDGSTYQIAATAAHWTAHIDSVTPYIIIAITAALLLLLCLCCCTAVRFKLYATQMKDNVIWLMSKTVPNPRPSPTPPQCMGMVRTLILHIMWLFGCAPRQRPRYNNIHISPHVSPIHSREPSVERPILKRQRSNQSMRSSMNSVQWADDRDNGRHSPPPPSPPVKRGHSRTLSNASAVFFGSGKTTTGYMAASCVPVPPPTPPAINSPTQTRALPPPPAPTPPRAATPPPAPKPPPAPTPPPAPKPPPAPTPPRPAPSPPVTRAAAAASLSAPAGASALPPVSPRSTRPRTYSNTPHRMESRSFIQELKERQGKVLRHLTNDD